MGYWRGPEGSPLDRAALVHYDTEGQIDLLGAASLTEWLAFETTEYGDDDWDDVVSACRAAGVQDELRTIDAWQEPSTAVSPADHQQERYQLHRDAGTA